MYGRLTNPKVLRCLSYGSIVINDVACNLHCTFFDISFQKNPLQYVFYIVCKDNKKIYLFIANTLKSQFLQKMEVYSINSNILPLLFMFIASQYPCNTSGIPYNHLPVLQYLRRILHTAVLFAYPHQGILPDLLYKN